jgi:Cu(I)/Ag(I) efflux system membrane protein CusA/SilA
LSADLDDELPAEVALDDAVEPARGLWEKLMGFFIQNKFIVAIFLLAVIAGGVYVAPFDWRFGGFPRDPVPVDAIPDISENQQVVLTEWPGRSPRDIEDQVTYPLTTALLGIPGVRTVRSASMFGLSSVYVIFEDGFDFYWTRSRVLEKLASLPANTLPQGVTPALGPDATALGQIFWYTLEGRDRHGRVVGGWEQHELRSTQDWIVRYALQGVHGVSEVASIGGFVREYQVDVDPEALRAHMVTLPQVAQAIRESNLDVGARTMEINQVEYLVRGLGFVREPRDLEEAVVAVRDHTPIRVRDVAHVGLGPALRRGLLDDGGAPAVGGVVVARYRENPMAVIARVRARIAQLAPGLPRRTLADGTVSQVTIVPFYDRTKLIHETLDTLTNSLVDEAIISLLVVLLILVNLRSSLLVSALLPLGVLFAFIAMKVFGVAANVMALGGIAIAIGAMVDVAIVFVENIVAHLDRAPPDANRLVVIRRAAAEVAPAVVTSVATTVVGFLPVFGLTGSEARLFTPLAFTKSFAMLAALVLSALALPPLAHVLMRRRPTAPEGDARGPRRVLRSVLRMEHMRDWAAVFVGLGLLRWSVPAGLFALELGVFRLARPLLSETVVTWWTRAEVAVTAIGVTLLLASRWLPLGHEQGLAINALFVASFVVLIMGGFRLFQAAYPAALRWCLVHRATFLVLPVLATALGLTAWLGFSSAFGWLPQRALDSRAGHRMSAVFPGFGREYMPPFDEGSFLYMPATMPHASIGAAAAMLSEINAAIAAIPEVDRVVGKLGRAESALDPAPISMFESVISYRPEYLVHPDGSRVRQWRSRIRRPRDIWDEIRRVADRPGVAAAPMLMPINARIVMLQSGMRAPMGVKIYGSDLESIERFGYAIEAILRGVPGVRPETVFADRVVGKPYLEIDLDRVAIGRYGLSVQQVQNVLMVGLGGMTLSRTVEGRERYPIRVRFMREQRDSVEALRRLTVPTPSGEQIPLGQLANLRYVRGPQVIKSENTFLTSYVIFDRRPELAEVDVVERAQAEIARRIASGQLTVPTGVRYAFAGSYENQLRSERRLAMLIPIALVLIFLLLYIQFRRFSTALLVYSGVVVSVSGGFMLVWLYGQPWFLNFSVRGTSMRELFQVGTVNISVATWIGFIALLGISTNNGVLVCTYLQQAWRERPPRSVRQVRELCFEAGVRRSRPALMTTATTILALLPVVTSQGRGADLMVPMALPSLGGMSIQLLTLFVVPVLYAALEEWRMRRRLGALAEVPPAVPARDPH